MHEKTSLYIQHQNNWKQLNNNDGHWTAVLVVLSIKLTYTIAEKNVRFGYCNRLIWQQCTNSETHCMVQCCDQVRNWTIRSDRTATVLEAITVQDSEFVVYRCIQHWLCHVLMAVVLHCHSYRSLVQSRCLHKDTVSNRGPWLCSYVKYGVW
jgi:hypothetical protein